jgi:hypothetical protein
MNDVQLELVWHEESPALKTTLKPNLLLVSQISIAKVGVRGNSIRVVESVNFGT